MELYTPDYLKQFKEMVHYNAIMFAHEARKWAIYDFVLNYCPQENIIKTRDINTVYEIEECNDDLYDITNRGLWDKIKNVAKKVGNGVKNIAKDGFNQVKTMVKDQVNACKGALVDLGKMTLDFGKKALNTVASSPLADLLPGGVGNLVQLANSVVNKPKEEAPQEEVVEQEPQQQGLSEEEKTQLIQLGSQCNETRKQLVSGGDTNDCAIEKIINNLKEKGLNDLQLEFLKTQMVDSRELNLYSHSPLNHYPINQRPYYQPYNQRPYHPINHHRRSYY
jgi:hypothetical protein